MTPEQERLFTMLEEVVAICNEHNITYYVAGGTTLGAMRHKGFIPWDDDIDLMMPYDDWNHFVEIAHQGGLPANRVLSCQELDIDYPHVFGRYTDTTSCAIHYNQMLGGTPEGFIIDIFILDPVPDAGAAYQRHRETLSLYNDLSNPLGYSYPMSTDRKKLQRYIKRIEKEGRRAVLGELAAELSSHDEATSEYLVMRWAAAPRLFHKSIFAFDRWEPFEGLDVRVPGKCADYLVQHYGDDWMYVPSGAGRIVHDAITFLDVDYKTVQEDYLPLIDVDRARKAILNRRAYHIRHMDDLRQADDLKAHIIASFVRRVTLERASACGIDFDEALAQARFDEIDAVFAEFYTWQTSVELEGREEYLSINRYHNPVYIDIGDELLRVAVTNLAHTNRVAKAARILRVRELAQGELSAPAQQAKRLVDAVRLPASLDDLGCTEEAAELSDYLIERYPQNFSNRVFYLGLLYRKGDFDRLHSCALEGLKLFPDAGEFAKYAVDCDYARGLEGQADGWKAAVFECYEEALRNTTNAALTEDVRQKVASYPDLDNPGLQALLESGSSRASQAVPGKTPSCDSDVLRAKVTSLLAELHELCQKNGIEHFLGPVACRLAYACGENAPAVPVLDMLVPAGKLDALAVAIEQQGREDRALDCWKTNGNHLSYQLDYVDKTTTFLQLDEGTNISAHGVKATVTPIRKALSGKEAKQLDMLETGWEINGYQLTKKVTKKRVLAAGAVRAKMALGKRRLAKSLYRSFNEQYGAEGACSIGIRRRGALLRARQPLTGGRAIARPYGDAEASASIPASQDVVIRFPGQEPFRCSRRYFEESETIRFCGREFPVPKDAESLLEQYFGSDWASEMRESSPSYKNALLSATVPYEELLAELAAEGHAPADLFKLMRRIRISMLPMANDLRIRNRAMAIARLSEDRKRIFDSLHAQEAAIFKLKGADDYDQLQAVFEEYELAAKRYLKQGLGLCPSKPYLDILCDLLHRKGEIDTAEKLARLAPEAHYRPLEM